MSESSKKTKYSELMDYLKNEILLGRILPNQQIPSENELAEKLSISRHTVRKALSLLVNEGYLSTEHGKGTFCKDRSLTRKASKNIAVITTYISEYIFPSLIHGIEKVLSENGFSLILKNTANDISKESNILKDILSNNIGGLIVEPTKSSLISDNVNYYRALDKLNIPYVFIHSVYSQLRDKPAIILDDSEGIYKAVSHLARLGLKDIVGIFKADDLQGISRHKGYTKALSEYEINYNPDNVIWFHTEDMSSKPTELLSIILEDRIPDAVVCYNDQIAQDIYELLSSKDLKIPDDISITGFDDSYIATNCPVKLTTLSHPKELLGETAASVLLEMMDDENYQNKQRIKVFSPELILRDSCKKN